MNKNKSLISKKQLIVRVDELSENVLIIMKDILLKVHFLRNLLYLRVRRRRNTLFLTQNICIDI